MRAVGIRELKNRASEIVRDVRENREVIDVTYRGRIVARIIPVDGNASESQAADAWADLDALGREIAKRWPPGVNAVDAVREVRREL
jgi:prevent-host-death family protein